MTEPRHSSVASTNGPNRVKLASVAQTPPQLPELQARVASASTWYHRLLLVVGGTGERRAALMQALSNALPAPYVNVSQALSEALLPLPRTERVAQVGPELDAITGAGANHVVLLDNIEVLFLPELRVDVLARLRRMSRNRTVVATWPGRYSAGRLTYAEADHPEHFEERGVEPLSVFMLDSEGILQS